MKAGRVPNGSGLAALPRVFVRRPHGFQLPSAAFIRHPQDLGFSFPSPLNRNYCDLLQSPTLRFTRQVSRASCPVRTRLTTTEPLSLPLSKLPHTAPESPEQWLPGALRRLASSIMPMLAKLEGRYHRCQFSLITPVQYLFYPLLPFKSLPPIRISGG